MSGRSAAAAAAGLATPPVAKPVFVRAGQGLQLQETERGVAARSAVARTKQGQVGVAMAKSAAVVRAQAVARVTAAGGDAADDLLVLSASVRPAVRPVPGPDLPLAAGERRRLRV